MNNISHLPFLPISPAILAESRFFMSADSCIVRAGFWMLEAAWRSPQPGSIPSGFESLSMVTRLTIEKLQDNYELLTAEWDLLDDGRLHYMPLEVIAQSVDERFGAELAVIAESALVACQGGNATFELVPVAEVKKKQRGKHALPKDFKPDNTSQASVIKEGYCTEEMTEWLMSSFRDYALSKDVRQSNWQATFRNYLGSTYTRKTFQSKFGHALGQVPAATAFSLVGYADPSETVLPKLSIAQRMHNAASHSMPTPRPTFAQIAADNNSNTMSGAMTRMLATAASNSASTEMQS